jgi:hypothetical protein
MAAARARSSARLRRAAPHSSQRLSETQRRVLWLIFEEGGRISFTRRTELTREWRKDHSIQDLRLELLPRATLASLERYGLLVRFGNLDRERVPGTQRFGCSGDLREGWPHRFGWEITGAGEDAIRA